MSRNKRALAILIALGLILPSALGESDSLISEEMIREETVNYRTAEAQSGIFEKTFSNGATQYYPYVYNLRFEQENVKFDDYHVHLESEVKAGDVLATFTRNADEVELVSQRLALQNAVEAFEEGKKTRREAIQTRTEALSDIALADAREIESLRIRRAQVELEQYIYQQETAIAEMEQRLAELEEDLSVFELTAPVDGVVANTLYKREGDRVFPSEVLVSMYRDEGMMLRVENVAGSFRYGMKATVEVGPNKQRTTLTGRVVGSDLLVPEKQRSGYAYIALDPYDEEDVRWINPTVTVSTYTAQNVILIPRKAIRAENGKYYVTKLRDGAVQKRFINFAMQNVDEGWVLQGLEVGETVILD